MAVEVTMPRLSDSMEEGTVLRWLKSVGDEVKRGDELVEIETDKANMIYEATDQGTLIEIVAQEGDTLPIGEVIARIGDPGEVKGDGRPAKPPEEEGEPEKKPEPAKPEPEEPSERERAPSPAAPRAERRPAPSAAPPAEREAVSSTDGRVKASPVARRMAGELGVELAAVQGSGPGGRIVKADVEAAAGRGAPARAAPPAGPPREAARPREPVAARPRAAPPTPETAKGEVEVVQLNRLQQTVARRMSESKATVPHFYLSMEIDMSEAVKMRGQLKQVVEEGRPAPTYNDMVVKACALALREFPRANGAYRDGTVELYSRVNVGIAVAGQDALVVPTIFDADRKSLGEIAVEARELAGKVRDGTVTPPELSGGTFTVSNLGMYGIDNFSAVINPPQAALLAVGAVAAKPAVDDTSGAIVARQLMGVTIACDHRILYGADGAQFLGRVRDLLQQPLALSL
jgi:pyruvate dehydrogenase E2 component (dihydrolipoyllysine-residue acetyltransferase)